MIYMQGHSNERRPLLPCLLTDEECSWLPLQYLVKRVYNLLEVLSLDMDINAGGVNARMSQQFLNGKDVNP